MEEGEPGEEGFFSGVTDDSAGVDFGALGSWVVVCSGYIEPTDEFGCVGREGVIGYGEGNEGEGGIEFEDEGLPTVASKS